MPSFRSAVAGGEVVNGGLEQDCGSDFRPWIAEGLLMEFQ